MIHTHLFVRRVQKRIPLERYQNCDERSQPRTSVCMLCVSLLGLNSVPLSRGLLEVAEIKNFGLSSLGDVLQGEEELIQKKEGIICSPGTNIFSWRITIRVSLTTTKR